MQIKKEELAKKLESLSKDLIVKLNEPVKDIANAIMFLSLYCGNNFAQIKEINLKFKDSSVIITKSEKSFDEKGQLCLIKSYDDSQSLEIIISKSYLKIEKKSENDFNYFIVEYFFDKNGSFVRKAKQKSMPLDREIQLEENSEGKANVGIYFSEIAERNENIEMTFFKIPDKNKVENIYYSYFANSEYKLFYKTPKQFSKIPTINAFGMSEVAELLSHQAEFTRFDDEKLFKDLIKALKSYYKSKEALPRS